MIRPPAVQGMFYPAHPNLLKETVDELLGLHTRSIKPDPLGIVVPHAGYQYSGSTAAAAYAQLDAGRYSTALIISPSHREYFDGISVFPGDAYATPLGTLEIDSGLRESLAAQSDDIHVSVSGHGEEHAIEVQLPFLQRKIPGIRILPVVIGSQSKEHIGTLAAGIAKATAGKHVILIASSDLSHFHDLSTAERLDAIAARAIERLEPGTLMEKLEDGETEACGGGPIAAMLYAALEAGATGCKILHQSSSAEVTRDTSRVVGYLSAAVYRN